MVIFSVPFYVSTRDIESFVVAIGLLLIFRFSSTGYSSIIVDTNGKKKTISLNRSELRIAVMNANGIGNGKNFFEWNQIQLAKILSFEYTSLGRGKGMIKREIEIIYFSRSSALDMSNPIDVENFIMVELSKRTYKYLKKFAAGKSKALDDILNKPVHWYKYSE